MHVAAQHDAAAQAGTVYRVLQRGSEREILSDNTGGAVYDAAIVLSRYLAAKEADHMAGKTVLVIPWMSLVCACVCELASL